MKNPPINLLRYWSRCQKGLPVYFAQTPAGRLSLRLGCSLKASDAPPLLYARLNKPTGRLLLHFIRTQSLEGLSLLQGGMLRIPAGCVLNAGLAELLSLPPEDHQLRAGTYPLLSDKRFLTASIQLLRSQSPATPLATTGHYLPASAR